MSKALSRIELLKQRLKEEKEKKESGGGGNFRGDIYPFWTMDFDESARVRILPDKNEENPYMFYVDRLEHKLSINGEDKRIPCRHMYGEDCPICELSRKFYKEQGKESKDGKYYWRDKTSLVRVLVLQDPLPANKETGETHEGKVFNTQFGYQLMEKIKEQIGSDDIGDFTDFEDGTDFIIKKTKNGQYGTYSVGSQFARKSSAIDDDLRDGIELIDLSSLLPADPGYDKVYNLLQAHLGAADYDGDDDKEDAPPPRTTKKDEGSSEKAVEKVEKAVEKEADTDDDDDDDIIAKIRRRKAAAAAAR